MSNNKGSVKILDLSRSENCSIDYTLGEDGGEKYRDMYAAIQAGCLQRIANAQESMARDVKSIARNVANISDKFPVTETQYDLLKKVIKLSARLKVAGLDGDPNSDNRGRPRNGQQKG